MRILFAVPGVHIPHVVTGGSMDIHEMTLTLRAMGHDVAVAAALPDMARSAGVRQLPYRIRQLGDRDHVLVFRDSDNGYETYRVGNWLVPRLVEERIVSWQPDIVVVQGYQAWNLALVAVSRRQPVVLRLIDLFGVRGFAEAVASDRRIAALVTDPLFRVICNSRFTAAAFEQEFGRAPSVIYPPIRRPAADYGGARPRYVTFVSPVPNKGLSVALQVATLLPQREFLFVNGTPTRRRELRGLRRELTQRPNVTWRYSSVGLDEVFKSTQLVLMPSQVQEAFGRVIVEAGHRGIPAVASRIGGIPEAIGDSGVLVDPDDSPEHWAEAIDGALTDHHCYARLSAAALANAARDEFDVGGVARRLLEILQDQAIRANVGVQVVDR